MCNHNRYHPDFVSLKDLYTQNTLLSNNKLEEKQTFCHTVLNKICAPAHLINNAIFHKCTSDIMRSLQVAHKSIAFLSPFLTFQIFAKCAQTDF